MVKGIAKFSLDEYLTQRVYEIEHIEFTAEVFEDGDNYILNPRPCELESVYQLPKSAVEVGKEEKQIACDNGEKKTVHRVKVARNAPCLRLTASSAGQFFGAEALALEKKALADLTLSARIAFTNNGEGHLSFGETTVKCLGNPTVNYTKDLTVQGVVGTDKFQRKYSNEYRVWMDYAVLIMGQRGIYIHEGPPTLQENGGDPSAGCIHVGTPDAKRFYDWVSGRTRITIQYPW